MKKNTESTEAGKQYDVAYAAQYSGHDLLGALKLYKEITVAHPNDQAAKNSLAQIQNIVKAVVPKQELLDAQMTMALSHLEQ